MANKNDSVVLQELRNRVNDLSIIDTYGLFFVEVARLVRWMDKIPAFKAHLSVLEFKKRKKEELLLVPLRDIYNEGKNIWLQIKKIPIKLEGLPEIFGHALATLMYIYDKGNIQYSDSIYHNLRYLVEYLADKPGSENIAEYFQVEPATKTPLISGKIRKLFLNYVKIEEANKKEAKLTTWGAWDELNFINYLWSRDDADYQLTEWSKSSSKDEQLLHLHRVSDYLFDSIVLKEEIAIYDPSSLEEFAIWNDDFEFKENVFRIGVYGEIKFHPDKSSMKSDITSGNPTTKFVEALVFAKDVGISKKDLAAKSGISERDISSYLSSLNERFSTALKRGDLKVTLLALAIGEKGKPIYKILVVPYQPNQSEASKLS